MWRCLVDRLRVSIETRRGISLVTRPIVRGLRPVLGANSNVMVDLVSNHDRTGLLKKLRT